MGGRAVVVSWQQTTARDPEIIINTLQSRSWSRNFCKYLHEATGVKQMQGLVVLFRGISSFFKLVDFLRDSA